MSQVVLGDCRVPFVRDLGSFGTPEVMVILGLFLPWKLGFCLRFCCCFLSFLVRVRQLVVLHHCFTGTFGRRAAVLTVSLSLKETFGSYDV